MLRQTYDEVTETDDARELAHERIVNRVQIHKVCCLERSNRNLLMHFYLFIHCMTSYCIKDMGKVEKEKESEQNKKGKGKKKGKDKCNEKDPKVIIKNGRKYVCR